MSLSRIELSAKQILEKDFKTAMRGYHQEEVDEFLDKVIQDYETFSKEIERLKSENERLKKSEDREPVVRERAVQQTTQQVNYDVLKRLSNLEKAVFGNKLTDTES